MKKKKMDVLTFFIIITFNGNLIQFYLVSYEIFNEDFK